MKKKTYIFMTLMMILTFAVSGCGSNSGAKDNAAEGDVAASGEAEDAEESDSADEAGDAGESDSADEAEQLEVRTVRRLRRFRLIPTTETRRSPQYAIILRMTLLRTIPPQKFPYHI